MSASNSSPEFGLLRENAEELGLPFVPPDLIRISTRLAKPSTDAPDQSVSAIGWGEQPAPLVFLHGGGQNAHTWDSVLLALGRPALAIDLPGHGLSDWRGDHDYSGQTNANAVAAVLRERASLPVALVGMSLGGLTAMSLTSRFPDLVKALLIVDVTPASAVRFAELTQTQRGSVALTSGPATFDSFDAMLDATVQASPKRSLASLRRGVLHNARELPDGSWTWRYDRVRKTATAPDSAAGDYARAGWEELSRINVPMTLVRGGDSGFVHDDDVAEMVRRQPQLSVHVVSNSGHSVQSDQPLELVRIIRDFLDAQLEPTP